MNTLLNHCPIRIDPEMITIYTAYKNPAWGGPTLSLYFLITALRSSMKQYVISKIEHDRRKEPMYKDQRTECKKHLSAEEPLSSRATLFGNVIEIHQQEHQRGCRSPRTWNHESVTPIHMHGVRNRKTMRRLMADQWRAYLLPFPGRERRESAGFIMRKR